MEARIARWEDVESVLARLSDQHRAEYDRLNLPEEELKARMARFMASGETRCLWFDDAPQAVLSIAPTAYGPVTWLAVTKEYFEKGRAALQFSRQYMADAAQRHGPILSFVGSQHPDVMKWMRLLGAEFVEERAGTKIFLFKA